MTQAVEKRNLSARGRKSAEAFRTISEAAGELKLPQHVLRFWETKFPHIRPLKRGGGRRYYRPEDLLLLHRIRDLLYDDGYTIKGNVDSMKYHEPDGRWYDKTEAEVYFASAEAAEAAGFTKAGSRKKKKKDD